MFEKADDMKEQYQFVDTFNLPNNEKSSKLTALALGMDDNLVCMTDTQQLFHCSLQNSNISKDHPNTFDYLLSPFHSIGKLGFAAITGTTYVY